jgi:RimJ/RimL family protein N-acetyltransferase
MSQLSALDRSSALPTERFPLPLETRRLAIRPFSEADADAIFSIHGDSLASRYMGGTLTREESRANLQALMARVAATGFGPFALVERASGSVVGWAGMQQLPGYPLIETLFALQPPSWGRGFATEATAALLDVSFGRLRIDEVVATVDPRNDASIRVLEKCGFTISGPIRHKLVPADGLLYRCSAKDFRQSPAGSGIAC